MHHHYVHLILEDPKGASKVLRAARYRRSITKKNPEIDNAEIKYVQHNRTRINYFELQQKNLSRVVDGNCLREPDWCPNEKIGYGVDHRRRTDCSDPSRSDFKQ